MTTPIQRQAFQAIKTLRVKELEGLMSHLRVFGPLPESSASATTADGTKPVLLSNPFVAKKNPTTGKWRPPVYSLRRQAKLVKMANETNTLDYLPPGPKTLAFQTRMQRVKASLPPADAVLLEKNFVLPEADLSTGPIARAAAELESKKEDLELAIVALRQERQPVLDQLRKEKEAALTDPDAPRQDKSLAKRYQRLVSEKNAELQPVIKQLARIQPALEAEMKTAKELAELWKTPIHWVGKVAEKTAGAELGVRLYANKKRMFKGHLWERQRASRVQKQAVLMRNMAARVARYKDYYKKRRPNPLKPSRYTKPPKLPF